jgi:hypothetical protein
MPYYRHNTEKIIYRLTGNPNITPTTHKGQHSGWTISGGIDITYADNPTNPKTHQLTKPEYKAAVSNFESKDSKDEALQDYFQRWAPADSVEITADEYKSSNKNTPTRTRPNHALQRTAPGVTAPASAAAFPSTMQVPRRPPQSLSLGSFGAFRAF